MFCKYCGAELPDGSKFCQFCGKKLDGPEYVQDTEPVQAPKPEVQDIPAPEPAPAPEPVPAPIPAPAPAPEPAPQQEIYIQPAYEQPVYEQPQQVYTPPVQDQPKKKSKKGLIIGLIIGGVVLIALILLFVLLILPMILGGKKVEIDFKKYAELKCEGYDSIGSADAEYDWDALLAEYGEDLKFTREYRNLEKTDDPKNVLQEMVYYYTDYTNYGTLSNGDSVDYHLSVYSDIGEILNVKIANQEEYDANGELVFPMTVSGLEEAELFDPFENIEITVTGFSPFGTLEYNLDNAPDPSKENYYAFEVDKQYDLANGDVVTITLDEWYAEDYFLTNYGMLPSTTTYEYTVEGLPELVTDVAQISAADMDYIKTVVKDIYYDEHISYDSEAIITNSYDVIGTILKVSKDPSEYGWDNNTLYCVIEQNCTVSQEGATTEYFTIYGVIYFNNLLVNSDGTLDFDEDDYDEDYNSYSMDVGNWTISGSYGYPSINDIRTKYINTSDAFYTYQDNIPK